MVAWSVRWFFPLVVVIPIVSLWFRFERLLLLLLMLLLMLRLLFLLPLTTSPCILRLSAFPGRCCPRLRVCMGFAARCACSAQVLDVYRAMQAVLSTVAQAQEAYQARLKGWKWCTAAGAQGQRGKEICRRGAWGRLA